MFTHWIAAIRSRGIRATRQLQIKTKTIIKILTTEYRHLQQAVTSRLEKRSVSKPFSWMVSFVIKQGRSMGNYVGIALRHYDAYANRGQKVYQSAIVPYLGLIAIGAFVMIGNRATIYAQADNPTWESELYGIEPAAVEQVLTALDPLTPEFTEAPESVASLLLAEDETYLHRPALANMSEAEQLSKKDPIPYTVNKGDTMVSIAKEFGRSVSTILDANGIKPEDASKLKPGTTLQIPQEDTSHSLAWLEAENRAKEEAARKLAEQRASVTKNRALAAASNKERSNQSYEGAGGDFIVPIRHNGITRGIGRGHTGVDYRADVGTNVAAGLGGRVVEITRGWSGGWGISIVIDHGGGLTSRYAHMSGVEVGIGQIVNQGELIGYSGNTGRSTGPHLHFEARQNGRVVSPF